jgi:hypothetical protein
MTLDEARRRARRLAAIRGYPAVICHCPINGWEVWSALEAARWLADDGELVLPLVVSDPDELEGQLRFEAARLRGRARLKLLEAAFAVRCRRWHRSRAAHHPVHVRVMVSDPRSER